METCDYCKQLAEKLHPIAAFGLHQGNACDTCRPRAMVFSSDEHRNHALEMARRAGTAPRPEGLPNVCEHTTPRNEA